MAQKHADPDLERGLAPRPFPYLRVLAAVVAILLVLSVLSVWFFRASLVETAARQWCQSKSLECAITVTKIGPGGAVLDLDLGGIGRPPALIARSMTLDLVWSNPLAPVLQSVSAQSVQVEMAWDGAAIDLGGIEALAVPADPEAPAPDLRFALDLPRIDLIVNTPVGVLKGDARATGKWPEALSASAAFQPTLLSGPAGEIALSRLAVAGDLAEGQIARGTISAGVDRFAFHDEAGPGLSGQDLDLSASIAPQGEGHRLKTSLVVALVERDTFRGEQARADLELDYTQIDASAPLGSITEARLTGAAARFALADTRTGAATLDLRIARAPGGKLTGPLTVSAEALATQQVTVARGAFEGDVDLQLPFIVWPDPAPQTDDRQDRVSVNEPVARLSGAFRAEGVNGLVWVEGLIGPLAKSAPAPLDQAIVDLAAQIENGARLFSVAAPIAIALTPEGWLAEAGDVAVSARSGLQIRLTGDGLRPPVLARSEGVELSGALALSGGGPAALSLETVSIGVVDGEIAFTTGKGRLGLESAQFDSALRLTRSEGRIVPGQTEIGWIGQTAYSGRLLDLDIAGLTLDGTMRLVLDERGTRVGVNTPCPVLRWTGLVQGAVTIGPAGGTLCALGEGGVLWSSNAGEGGVLFRPGQLGLRLDDALALSAGLEGAVVRVPSNGDGALSVAIAYSALSGKIAQDGGEIVLELGAGRADVRLPAGVAEARGVVTGRVSGSALPVAVLADAASFNVRNDVAGLALSFDTLDVLVEDIEAPKRFSPLRVQGEGTLNGSRARLEGTIKLDASRVVLADFVAEDDRIAGEGWINLNGRSIVFRPGELQMSDISPLLLGVASNANGLAQLDARADWSSTPDPSAGLKASGTVRLDDLSFATFRLGPITGVSGEIRFDDLIAVHTPPGQRLNIARINPGLVLDGGIVLFQVLSPTEFILERAAWPFAGGLLSIEETRWATGSEEERVVAVIEDLDLGLFLDTFDVPGLEATGTASGRVPLVIRGPQLLIDGAVLKADGGRIRYVNDMARAAGQANEATQVAFQALENFTYSVLELGLDGDIAGRMNVSAILEGANPDVIYGIPIRFEIAVDAPLMSLVHQGGSMLSGTQAVQTVKDAVREGRSERVGPKADRENTNPVPLD